MQLFSAYAEVFPRWRGANWQRGGSSPHTRRYFQRRFPTGRETRLFSAYAEVFPGPARPRTVGAPLLRIRGGISEAMRGLLPHEVSSPHTRRYFQDCSPAIRSKPLFSAYAEVFPMQEILDRKAWALLRIRGGISANDVDRDFMPTSSPHTRRYFHLIHSARHRTELFSAYAEVFPNRPMTKARRAALLRIRGGISSLVHRASGNSSSSPHTRRYFRDWPC